MQFDLYTSGSGLNDGIITVLEMQRTNVFIVVIMNSLVRPKSVKRSGTCRPLCVFVYHIFTLIVPLRDLLFYL